MSLVISDDMIKATGMTEMELKQEMAILLFEKDKLTLSQACQLADTPPLQFQRLLADRQIPVHYDVAAFEADLETLEQLKRL